MRRPLRDLQRAYTLSARSRRAFRASALSHRDSPQRTFEYFSALLEIRDPQRFTRGVEVRPKDLDLVMVRRLNPICAAWARSFRSARSSRFR
jgi:hypothetical protein